MTTDTVCADPRCTHAIDTSPLGGDLVCGMDHHAADHPSAPEPEVVMTETQPTFTERSYHRDDATGDFIVTMRPAVFERFEEMLAGLARAGCPDCGHALDAHTVTTNDGCQVESCLCDYPWDLPDEEALLEAMRAAREHR